MNHEYQDCIYPHHLFQVGDLKMPASKRITEIHEAVELSSLVL